MGWHLADLPSLLVKAPGSAFPQRWLLQWAQGVGEEGGRPGMDSRWAIRFAHSPALRLLWSPQLLGSDSAAGQKPALECQ